MVVEELSICKVVFLISYSTVQTPINYLEVWESNEASESKSMPPPSSSGKSLSRKKKREREKEDSLPAINLSSQRNGAIDSTHP